MIQGDMSIEDLLDDLSLNDLRTLFVHELVTAIGAEELDLPMPKLLPVTIKLALALRAGHPKNFRHGSLSPQAFGNRSMTGRGMKSSSRVFSIAAFGTVTRASKGR